MYLLVGHSIENMFINFGDIEHFSGAASRNPQHIIELIDQ